MSEEKTVMRNIPQSALLALIVFSGLTATSPAVPVSPGHIDLKRRELSVTVAVLLVSLHLLGNHRASRLVLHGVETLVSRYILPLILLVIKESILLLY